MVILNLMNAFLFTILHVAYQEEKQLIVSPNARRLSRAGISPAAMAIVAPRSGLDALLEVVCP